MTRVGLLIIVLAGFLLGASVSAVLITLGLGQVLLQGLLATTVSYLLCIYLVFGRRHHA